MDELPPTPPPLPLRRVPPVPPPLPPRLSATRLETHLQEPPSTLHPGLPDDYLNSLLRRFNRQVVEIRGVDAVPGRLDFSPANETIFSPEILRSNVERVYLTAFKSGMLLWRQIELLRSWTNPLRSGSFCVAYFLAWKSRLGVAPTLFSVLSLLILSPGFRSLLFPPIPSSIAVTKEGGMTEREHQEMEASEFVQDAAELATAPIDESEDQSSLAEVLLSEGDSTENNEPSHPLGSSVPTDSNAGKKATNSTRVDHLAKHGLPLQVFAGDFADALERWANAFTPVSPPYPTHAARIKVAAHILPIVIALLVLPVAFVVHALTFLAGFLFFGGPILSLIGPALDFFIAGDWREAIELRNSMLSGVPSNTQLTARLLRDAEAAGTPLPPPAAATHLTSPLSSGPARQDSTSTTFAETSSISDSASFSEVSQYPAEEAREQDLRQRKGGSGKVKLAALVRTVAKITESGAGYASGQRQINWEKVSRVAVDKLKQSTGSQLPEHIMSIIPRQETFDDRTNSTFYAHCQKVPGHLLLRSGEGSWSLEFVRMGKKTDPLAADVNVRIPVSCITEMKRSAGLGWKGRIAAGWVMGVESHGGNGINLKWEVDNLPGSAKFSAIVRRDELFNRLVGLSPCCFSIL